MRLFIAIDAPAEINEIFVSLQKDIDAGEGLKFVRSFHLTLKFLGEVAESKVDEVRRRLKDVEFEPFKASLEGLGVFPSENYIRVVWVGLEPEDKFMELQEKVEESLHGMFAKESDFKPHITLARVKFIKDKDALIRKIGEAAVPRKEFEVSRIRLFRSTLTKQGPIYEELEI